MKAVIKKVEFKKEYESKFGTMYSFEVCYDDKRAYYTAKKKDQTTFVEGQEAEFIEEKKAFTKKDGSSGEYLTIKIPQQMRQSNFGKALTKEQSRYSGFAVSYCKDLIVAGKVEFADLQPVAWMLFDLMVEMDKSLEK
jgi:hypothetical protein